MSINFSKLSLDQLTCVLSETDDDADDDENVFARAFEFAKFETIIECDIVKWASDGVISWLSIHSCLHV